jgi:hypothetical protein
VRGKRNRPDKKTNSKEEACSGLKARARRWKSRRFIPEHRANRVDDLKIAP